MAEKLTSGEKRRMLSASSRCTGFDTHSIGMPMTRFAIAETRLELNARQDTISLDSERDLSKGSTHGDLFVLDSTGQCLGTFLLLASVRTSPVAAIFKLPVLGPALLTSASCQMAPLDTFDVTARTAHGERY